MMELETVEYVNDAFRSQAHLVFVDYDIQTIRIHPLSPSGEQLLVVLDRRGRKWTKI
jgi:hypothetical protein